MLPVPYEQEYTHTHTYTHTHMVWPTLQIHRGRLSGKAYNFTQAVIITQAI